MTDSYHSYPKVWALGHSAIKELLFDEVTVEEKVDGSQFSFGRFNGEFKCRSKGAHIIPDAPEAMFAEGVAFFTIADLVKPKPETSHVFFKSYDGYSTNNPLDVCMDDDVLIAHTWNGHPLTKEHGGPARVIIPKRYAWKGAKFIREITFLDRDILGFWELRGYSNTADPWTEDRFS